MLSNHSPTLMMATHCQKEGAAERVVAFDATGTLLATAGVADTAACAVEDGVAGAPFAAATTVKV
jgi:hypothetical protein